jgi:hypothetical protein
MPAFNHKDELASRFVTYITPWLNSVSPSPSDFAQFHYALDSLQYLLSTDRAGWNMTDPPLVSDTIRCQHDNCSATWRTPDACLLLLNGRWLCRAHHPPFSSLPPPGWMPPRS